MPMVHVPTRVEIIRKLDSLAAVVSNAGTLTEVADKVLDELAYLECAVFNRAGIESGRITDDDGQAAFARVLGLLTSTSDKRIAARGHDAG